MGWDGYLALFITVTLFSGMFAKSTEWRRISDFTTPSGASGQVSAAGDMAVSLHSTGGVRAKDDFSFTSELTPSVILSFGIISVTEGLGELCAAQQLMALVLHPLLGISGICSLTLIANLQNTNATVGTTKEMAEEGIIIEQERTIFACWQISGNVCTINCFSSGAALFTMVTIPVITPLVVILVFKLVGMGLLRVWIAQLENRCIQQET